MSGAHLTFAGLHRRYGSAFAGGRHLAVLIGGVITLLAAALALSQLRSRAAGRDHPATPQAEVCDVAGQGTP